jgi:hypothetical protein
MIYQFKELIIIRIDSSLVEQVRNTDMLVFLENRYGFTFAHHGGAYRCRQHPSLAVKNDGLSWYWHSKGIGGHGAIDYLMKIEAMPFRQAVESVMHIHAAPIRAERQQDKRLILPEKAGIPLRLYDYLCNRRGIDAEIVNALLDDGNIYEDKRSNVVFVGFDEQSAARFASLRGTYGDQQFRMDCAGSDKRYGFHMTYAQSERLYIFESPIDAMSHASFADEWRRDNRLSLAGTSDTALPKYLESHPQTTEIVLCLDNDQPGREASIAIARKYAGQGYRTRIELPSAKDYNEDLLKNIERGKPQKITGNLHKETYL